MEEDVEGHDPEALVQDMFNDFASSTALALAIFAVNSIMNGDEESLKEKSEEILAIWRNGTEHIMESVTVNDKDRKIVMECVDDLVDRVRHSWQNVWRQAMSGKSLDG